MECKIVFREVSLTKQGTESRAFDLEDGESIIAVEESVYDNYVRLTILQTLETVS